METCLFSSQTDTTVDILDRIIEAKKHEVARAKARMPLHVLQSLVHPCSTPYAFTKALTQTHTSPHIIAEIKRASPAKGVLLPHLKPYEWSSEHLSKKYVQGGAAALSVLTDVRHFWGDPDALRACAQASGLPVLRKDFVVDVYQVDESRWYGADAVLLIARVLSEDLLQQCAQRARELGMSVLVEVHGEHELAAALRVPEALLGVNNRDLGTMTLDWRRSARMREHIPQDRVVVAESGLHSPEHIQELVRCGVHAFLIGEHLAAHPDPAGALKTLRGAV